MGHPLEDLANGTGVRHVKGDAQELVVGEGDVVANDEVKIPLMRGRMSYLTIRPHDNTVETVCQSFLMYPKRYATYPKRYDSYQLDTT